jgi:KDEL-tailed cysteine endopeptidase
MFNQIIYNNKMLRIIACGALLFASTVSSLQTSYPNGVVVEKFRNWIERFNIYIADDHHFAHVFENWLSNDKFIEFTNAQNLTYTVGHNAYSGYNSEEFAQLMGFQANRDLVASGNLRGAIQQTDSETTYDLSALPTSVDWRTKGAVTGVKDQGQCGSCWSFSSTGSLEGAYAISKGSLVSFSEQELVDCANIKNGGPNMGCNGGNMQPTLDWIGKNGGLCTEQAYPYVSGVTKSAGTCQKSCSLVSGSAVRSSHAVTANSDNAMMTALSMQPVSIAIEADQRAFQMYKSGVFGSENGQECGTQLDHGVLLVGYGSSNGQDYYIMKNSWGTTWGESGYMRMGRGPQYNNGAGQCGLLMEGSYPTL